jgi:hypothetical protein
MKQDDASVHNTSVVDEGALVEVAQLLSRRIAIDLYAEVGMFTGASAVTSATAPVHLALLKPPSRKENLRADSIDVTNLQSYS